MNSEKIPNLIEELHVLYPAYKFWYERETSKQNPCLTEGEHRDLFYFRHEADGAENYCVVPADITDMSYECLLDRIISFLIKTQKK